MTAIDQGRPLINWRNRPMLFHPHGCRLCCPARVTRGDDREIHPPDCRNCGPDWSGVRPDPCRHCGRIAHFRDGTGLPTHKTCHENALATDQPHQGDQQPDDQPLCVLREAG
jgi:hypothetical protein